MKNKIQFLILSLISVTSICFAQRKEIEKADEKFKKLAYIDAIDIYKKVAEKGFKDEEIYKKLGDAYYFNADYDEALKWYNKLFIINPDCDTEYYFRYGQTLKATNNYTKADSYLKKYFNFKGANYTKSTEYLSDIEKNSNLYIINKIKHNTKYSDYPAYLKNNVLYAVSANLKGKINDWNNEPASNIQNYSQNSGFKPIKNLSTIYNEGSLVITKDGNTMYFTRNDFIREVIEEEDGYRDIRLKIYKAEKVNGDWDNITELPFGSPDYSIAHPALSLDEKKLYFVSDMPNSLAKGGTDLYEVEIFEDGSFGVPLNISEINTVGNEMFPFIAHDNTLYFSSNGHASNLGGLDVYASKIIDGSFKTPQNLGTPINSNMDDFSFMINYENTKGYFASNRKGTKSDDIYLFVPNKNYKKPCSVTLKGDIRDEKTNELIRESDISLIDIDNKTLKYDFVKEGNYYFEDTDCGAVKFIRVEKDSYQTKEVSVDTTEEGEIVTDIYLASRKIETGMGVDIAQYLNPIYFDLDKSNIRPDAQIELEKVIQIMNLRPTLKIDVRSHTDGYSSDAYNLKLSDRRVKSTINYIVNNGIRRSRLSGRGYGESQLLNDCKEAKNCTDEENQRNRRSEFIIVSE